MPLRTDDLRAGRARERGTPWDKPTVDSPYRARVRKARAEKAEAVKKAAKKATKKAAG